MVIVKKMNRLTPQRLVSAAAECAAINGELRAELAKADKVEADVKSALEVFAKKCGNAQNVFGAYNAEYDRNAHEVNNRLRMIGEKRKIEEIWKEYQHGQKLGYKHIGELPKDPATISIPDVAPIPEKVASEYERTVAVSVDTSRKLGDAVSAYVAHSKKVESLEAKLREAMSNLIERRKQYDLEKRLEDDTTAQAKAEEEEERRLEIEQARADKAEAEERLKSLGVAD